MRKAVLLLALLAALAAPTTAFGAAGIKFGIQDDAWLNGGPLDTRLNTLDRLGPDVVRYTLRWDQIARKRPKRAVNPNDKAYDWRDSDAVLTGLRKHHISALVTLYGSPGWANGHHAPNFVPLSRNTLAAFAVAAAKRYPWVSMWEVWNEPNLRTFLRPNSPSLYVRRLLNPTYAALHDTHRGVRVAGGATSPRQTPTGTGPVAFMRGMRAAHARMDAYSHHPYPVSRRETPSELNCRYCKGVLTLARLPELLQEVRRDFGAKRVWLTEYGYQTNPPDRYLGVSRALQAKYLAQAAYLAWKAPRVDVLVHFMIRDEQKTGRWQSGLFTLAGARKPSFSSFAMPFVQVSRHGSRTVLWGQDRPGFGRQKYVLERVVGSRWRPVGSAKLTTQRGYIVRVVKARRGARFRLRDVNTKATSTLLVVR